MVNVWMEDSVVDEKSGWTLFVVHLVIVFTIVINRPHMDSKQQDSKATDYQTHEVLKVMSMKRIVVAMKFSLCFEISGSKKVQNCIDRSDGRGEISDVGCQNRVWVVCVRVTVPSRGILIVCWSIRDMIFHSQRRHCFVLLSSKLTHFTHVTNHNASLLSFIWLLASFCNI